MTPGTAPEYAAFWRRMLAWVLDMFLLNIVTSLALYLCFGDSANEWIQQSLQALQKGEPPQQPPPALLIPISLLLPAVYTCLFWVKLKALPAQMLLNMQVINARSGQALGITQAVVRYMVLTLLPYAVLFLELQSSIAGSAAVILIYLGTRFHPRRQCLHDLAAGSVVIMKPAAVSPVPQDFQRKF